MNQARRNRYLRHFESQDRSFACEQRLAIGGTIVPVGVIKSGQSCFKGVARNTKNRDRDSEKRQASVARRTPDDG